MQIKNERKARKCLSCRKDFSSDGPHNRICFSCKRKHETKGLNETDLEVKLDVETSAFVRGQFPEKMDWLG